MYSFGMMNEAYFVGKKVLIDWVNNFLEINIEKVEQMANGAIYCNLWDALHPGTIPMSRVDFTVKHDYDFAKNWKLMQNGFQKAGIEKMIPVQRLIKGRYQDNLEFMQWMYKYARDTYNGDPDDPSYDAIGRRSKSKGGRDYTGSNKAGAARKARGSRPTSGRSGGSARAYTGKSKVGGALNRERRTGAGGLGNNRARGAASKANDQELQQLRDENKRLSASRDDVQSKCDGMQERHDEIEKIAKDMEDERDFYFNKVVAIENVLKEQPDQNSLLLEEVYKILYQTEEDVKATSLAPQDDQHDVGM